MKGDTVQGNNRKSEKLPAILALIERLYLQFYLTNTDLTWSSGVVGGK